ncbi:MAG: NfeD family protein [Muribaculaceae bacterium]|nr:NfeD family protein [Muribaculaceae bacterium]
MIEYFSQNLWQVWAIIAVVCLILELFSGDFFILCFSIGAAVSLLSALCGASLTAQIILFAVASVLSVLFVRPVALKYFHRNDPERASNADALMGREGRVSQTIVAGGHGRVAIDGDDWKAVSVDGSAIAKDTPVRVVNRDSIILTVEPVL